MAARTRQCAPSQSVHASSASRSGIGDERRRVRLRRRVAVDRVDRLRRAEAACSPPAAPPRAGRRTPRPPQAKRDSAPPARSRHAKVVANGSRPGRAAARGPHSAGPRACTRASTTPPRSHATNSDAERRAGDHVVRPAAAAQREGMPEPRPGDLNAARTMRRPWDALAIHAASAPSGRPARAGRRLGHRSRCVRGGPNSPCEFPKRARSEIRPRPAPARCRARARGSRPYGEQRGDEVRCAALGAELGRARLAHRESRYRPARVRGRLRPESSARWPARGRPRSNDHVGVVDEQATGDETLCGADHGGAATAGEAATSNPSTAMQCETAHGS